MDKVIFVTGATKNTGYAIAEKYAQNGYNVALSSRDLGSAKTAAKKITNDYNVKACGYALNLLDYDDIKRVFNEIKNDFGGLDTFVANSANLGVDLDLLSATPELFDNVMNVNLKGTYFCCQQAALIMKEKKHGAIVIIGSVHYKQAIWGRSLYSCSKGALASLTRSMAIELSEYGVRTNYIVCGAIHTQRWNDVTDEQNQKRRLNYPVGVESSGEDIANGAFYLGTDLSKTVTGTDLTIDSGIGVCLLPYNGGIHK